MGKLKSFLLGSLSTVLAATIAIGGTLAFLTDRDSEVNTFTVGDVAIDLIEDFQQGAELIPGVEIKKNVTIENVGDNDAWVWFTYAVPTALVDTGNNASKNAIHLNIPGRYWYGYHTNQRYWTEGQTEPVADDDTWMYDASMIQHNITTIEEGVEYSLVTWMYKGALTPGEITNIGLEKIYLDPHVDITPEGDWYWVENGETTSLNWNTETNGTPKIIVSAYAIQDEGFETVQAAYAAYNKQWAENGTEYFVPARIPVAGSNKSAILEAIDQAEDGDIIVLQDDTNITGTAGNEKLTIDKAVTLDLNGKTLTTECYYGGIDAKGGCSIINGTINHVGRTAAIKAFQVERIENVTINVTEEANKVKGGIVVQNGANDYVGSIKNVTINGATNGIQCYRSTKDNAIGTMEKVTVNATKNGIWFEGAGSIGKMTNCQITGGVSGIEAYLANLWHISMNIEKCQITGTTGYGIDMWDEGATNAGSTMTLVYDEDTTISGGTNDLKATLQEEITCTINGKELTTPCDYRENF